MIPTMHSRSHLLKQQNYEVHCGSCGWWGYERQLKVLRTCDPLQDDVVFESCCPSCLSWSYLEYEEDISPSASSLEIALANLEQAKATLNESLKELTSWLKYQQQS